MELPLYESGYELEKIQSHDIFTAFEAAKYVGIKNAISGAEISNEDLVANICF